MGTPRWTSTPGCDPSAGRSTAWTARPVDRFAAAARVLLDESPLRAEWLAVAKLEPLDAPTAARVAAAAERWSAARDLLAEVAPAVRRRAAEYRAFALLVEILAHAYDAAATADESELSRLLDAGEAVLAAVDDDWDRGRFADDPRKYTAPVASFQDDHLIPVLKAGLARLRDRRAAATTTTTTRATPATVPS